MEIHGMYPNVLVLRMLATRSGRSAFQTLASDCLGGCQKQASLLTRNVTEHGAQLDIVIVYVFSAAYLLFSTHALILYFTCLNTYCSFIACLLFVFGRVLLLLFLFAQPMCLHCVYHCCPFHPFVIVVFFPWTVFVSFCCSCLSTAGFLA